MQRSHLPPSPCSGLALRLIHRKAPKGTKLTVLEPGQKRACSTRQGFERHRGQRIIRSFFSSLWFTPKVNHEPRAVRPVRLPPDGERQKGRPSCPPFTSLARPFKEGKLAMHHHISLFLSPGPLGERTRSNWPVRPAFVSLSRWKETGSCSLRHGYESKVQDGTQ